MSLRPQNRCTDCTYTWYPRGKNRSLRCPNCGSGAVEVVTVPLALVVGTLAALGIAAMCAGLVGGNRRGPTENRAPVAVAGRERDADPTPAAAPARPPRAGARPGGDGPAPIRAEPVADERPVAPVPVPDPLPRAPSPRTVDHSVPPPGAAFRGEWQRVGVVETRVAGALVGPVPLRNRAGLDFVSLDPALRVWVESRAVSGSGVEVRRWASTLDPAKLWLAPGKPVPRSAVASGSDVRGELYGTHRMLPGGEPVRDVLLFRVPSAGADELLLTLDGEHVGQSGRFRHYIPAAAWAK